MLDKLAGGRAGGAVTESVWIDPQGYQAALAEREQGLRDGAAQAAKLGSSLIKGLPWLKIAFVSDVVCPWCAIGLQSLLAALNNLGGSPAELHFEPFELNPDMGPAGEDIAEHIAGKYGSSPQQFAQSQQMIRDRGAQLGFRFDMQKRTRIFNTFDAHRLLHWAGMEGRHLN